jgi:hypothetical protein
MAFKLDIQQREFNDVDNFMTILLQATPTIRVITVQKQRELHILDTELMTVLKTRKEEQIVSLNNDIASQKNSC